MHDTKAEPTEFWEELYAGKARWSGNPNPVLVDVVGSLPPGRSLDLGCGEGADVLWLASKGWEATGVDISSTAITRAREAAEHAAAAIEGSSRFESGDLAPWLTKARVEGLGPLDLVTASFFQSPLESFDRVGLINLASEMVRPGGFLFALSHFAPPDWAPAEHRGHGQMPTPWGEVLDLAVPAGSWTVQLSEVREREVTGPQGEVGKMRDTVVLLRRER